jgi:hypothetical protein
MQVAHKPRFYTPRFLGNRHANDQGEGITAVTRKNFAGFSSKDRNFMMQDRVNEHLYVL